MFGIQTAQLYINPLDNQLTNRELLLQKYLGNTEWESEGMRTEWACREKFPGSLCRESRESGKAYGHWAGPPGFGARVCYYWL